MWRWIAVGLCLLLAGCSFHPGGLFPAGRYSNMVLTSGPLQKSGLTTGNQAELLVTLRAERRVQTMPSAWTRAVFTLSNPTLLSADKTIVLFSAPSASSTATFANLRIGEGYSLAVSLFNADSEVAHATKGPFSLAIGGSSLNLELALDPAAPAVLLAGPAFGVPGFPITLEGNFGSQSVLVNFPGAAGVTATAVGSRVTATVPAGGSSGGLSVTVGTKTSYPIPFRSLPFQVGFTGFGHIAPQGLGPVVTPRLSTPRDAAAGLTIGNYVYVIGGETNGVPLATVERAPILVSGALGAFAPVGGVSLNTPRSGHTAAIVGDALFILGGRGPSGILNSVERASINADGSLGSFQTKATLGSLPDLPGPRTGHSCVVIGNYLYLIGGFDGTSALSTLVRAPIDSNGDGLGAFAVVPQQTLNTPRFGQACALINNYLYVFGGFSGSAALGSIESSAVNGDGTLKGFNAAGTLQARRYGANVLVLGSFISLTGGYNETNGSLKTKEVSAVQPDGSLGPFVVDASDNLWQGRDGAVGVVVGNAYGLLGGHSSDANKIMNYLDSGGTIASGEGTNIEASINPSLGSAQYASSLAVPRYGHGYFAGGDRLYVFGGFNDPDGLPPLFPPPGPPSPPPPCLRSIEVATVKDGNLGPFAVDSSRQLAVPRAGHAVVTIGNQVFAIGGQPAGPILDPRLLAVTSGVATDSIESAALDGSGDLASSFQLVSTRLTKARRFFATVVTSSDDQSHSYLYAIGGIDAHTPFGDVERSEVTPSGLGPFSAVATASSSLHTARAGAASFVIGTLVYVAGGYVTVSGSGGLLGGIFGSLGGLPSATDDVEVAPINEDGSLGQFSQLPGVRLPNPNAGMVAFLHGTKVFLAGGLSNDVVSADIGADGTPTGFKASGVTMASPRVNLVGVELGESFYALGGKNFAYQQVLGTVEELGRK